MSFLTETAIRRLAMTSRTAMVQAPRAFSTGVAYRKSATDTVKDTVKKVDRAVSDKLVDGINVTSKVFPQPPPWLHSFITNNA